MNGHGIQSTDGEPDCNWDQVLSRGAVSGSVSNAGQGHRDQKGPPALRELTIQ